MTTPRPTPDELARFIRSARTRALTCPIHQCPLDPNGKVCASCILVSRRPELAGAMRPISQILETSKEKPCLTGV